MARLGTVIFAMATLLGASAAQAQALKCTPTQKLVCSQGKGCEETKADTWAIVDFGRKTYARCTADGCDNFNATLTDSGTYTPVELPGRATMAKISDNGTMFSEVTSLLSSILISFGACAPTPPPSIKQ